MNKRGLLERAIAVAEQNPELIGSYRRTAGGHDQVGLSVAIDVADADGGRIHSHGIVRRRLERPVPVAQQNSQAAVVGRCAGRAIVHGDKIELTVAVQIGQRDGDGIRAGRDSAAPMYWRGRGRPITGFSSGSITLCLYGG